MFSAMLKWLSEKIDTFGNKIALRGAQRCTKRFHIKIHDVVKDAPNGAFFYKNSKFHRHIIFCSMFFFFVFFTAFSARLFIAVSSDNIKSDVSAFSTYFDIVIAMSIGFIINYFFYKFVTLPEKLAQDKYVVNFLRSIAKAAIHMEDMSNGILTCKTQKYINFLIFRMLCHLNDGECKFVKGGMCTLQETIEATLRVIGHRLSVASVASHISRPQISEICLLASVTPELIDVIRNSNRISIKRFSFTYYAHLFFKLHGTEFFDKFLPDFVHMKFSDAGELRKCYEKIYQTEKALMRSTSPPIDIRYLSDA